MNILTVISRKSGVVENAKSFKDDAGVGRANAMNFFIVSILSYFPAISDDEIENFTSSGHFTNGSIDIEIVHSYLE